MLPIFFFFKNRVFRKKFNTEMNDPEKLNSEIN